MLVFCVVGGVYLVGGVVINHRKGKSKADLIPHRAFWANLPGTPPTAQTVSWFLPAFLCMGVFSAHRCVLPYTSRKLL